MTTHINGYAFAKPEVQDEHAAAWDKVKHIEGAITRKQGTYAAMIVTLDADKTKGLTSLEKLVLAGGGPAPFGGRIESPTRVVFYTD